MLLVHLEYWRLWFITVSGTYVCVSLVHEHLRSRFFCTYQFWQLY